LFAYAACAALRLPWRERCAQRAMPYAARARLKTHISAHASREIQWRAIGGVPWTATFYLVCDYHLPRDVLAYSRKRHLLYALPDLTPGWIWLAATLWFCLPATSSGGKPIFPPFSYLSSRARLDSRLAARYNGGCTTFCAHAYRQHSAAMPPSRRAQTTPGAA